MPQYTQTTLSSAVTQLSSRLNDSNNVYYTQTEAQNSIIEALRWLQCLTGFYRERETFSTSANVIFYDLRTVLNTPATGYPYLFSVTDDQLLSQIQYHLIEQVANPQTISQQFPVSVIAQALTRTRDMFLTDTGLYLTRSLPFSGMPTNGRIQLPQTLLDVRRAAWQDSSTSKTYRLSRQDEYSALGYSRSWPQNPTLPYSYSIALTPPISLQLIPAPSNTGTLDLVSLNSGPTLGCSPSSPVIVGLPDDYCWAVKYGAISDLLGQDGPSADLARSQYCRMLYGLGMTQARKTITVLLGRIEDIETSISTIEDFDSYRNSWQNTAATTPTDLIICGPNLLAVSPQPDTAYTISIDMVRTMIVPQSGGDFLQVDQSMVEPILDLAQHIISLKLGWAEFQDTNPLRNNFLRMAATMNSRLRANIFFKLLLEDPAVKPEQDLPRLDPDPALSQPAGVPSA